MNLRYRRVIYFGFILLFLIFTPFVLLYTAGYSLNLKKGQLVKTGILYVDSKPKAATILINGKERGKTPLRFTKLLPDNYFVEVKKDGYYSWQKDVEIKSNLTEFMEDIILFKNVLPTNLIAGKINIFSTSPDKKYFLYSIYQENNEELRLLNIKNNEDTLIKKFLNHKNNPLELVGWSTIQGKVIIKEKLQDFNNYFVYNAGSQELKEIMNITRTNFNKLDWGLENDVYLYGATTDGLYQFDLEKNSVQKIISEKIINFSFNGNTLYYLSQSKNDVFLNKKIFGVQANAQPDEIQKIKLPTGSKFVLQKSKKGYIVILDQKNNDLFIISENSFNDKNIENNIILQDKANQISWSDDSSMILYNNDFEIWTFDLNTKQKNLVTRYSEIITQAIWYPGNKYIIFNLNNKIQAIESLPYKQRNEIKLAEMPEIANINMDAQGKNLYFTAKAGNQQGIYQLQLQ